MQIPLTTKNLGNIPYNVPVQIEYDIVNNSEDFLTISNIQTGCGCSSGNMSINPIPPNQTGKFIIAYSANARGSNSKSASFSALDNTHHFYFNANVV